MYFFFREQICYSFLPIDSPFPQPLPEHFRNTASELSFSHYLELQSPQNLDSLSDLEGKNDMYISTSFILSTRIFVYMEQNILHQIKNEILSTFICKEMKV